ncbi:hypothetical protein ACWD3J_10780 [Streptomyces sp. NPDC002755]
MPTTLVPRTGHATRAEVRHGAASPRPAPPGGPGDKADPRGRSARPGEG